MDRPAPVAAPDDVLVRVLEVRAAARGLADVAKARNEAGVPTRWGSAVSGRPTSPGCWPPRRPRTAAVGAPRPPADLSPLRAADDVADPGAAGERPGSSCSPGGGEPRGGHRKLGPDDLLALWEALQVPLARLLVGVDDHQLRLLTTGAAGSSARAEDTVRIGGS